MFFLGGVLVLLEWLVRAQAVLRVGHPAFVRMEKNRVGFYCCQSICSEKIAPPLRMAIAPRVRQDGPMFVTGKPNNQQQDMWCSLSEVVGVRRLDIGKTGRGMAQLIGVVCQ
jgi:hypothetical protein